MASGSPGGELPEGFRIRLDTDTRQNGSVLIGGSPVRILRLTPDGQRLVARLAGGAPVSRSAGTQRLARRLLDGGLAHPHPPSRPDRPDVVVVIPVRDDPAGLCTTLDAIEGHPSVVVDDGSGQPDAVVGASRRAGARWLRRATSGGPAAARNAGWRASAGDVVAFVDANCEPQPGWLDVLLPHFTDPQVGAVAPRIVATAAPGAPWRLTAYEERCSPLDLGPREAVVRPRSQVPYVPATTLVVRREALETVGGFDETLRFGEDVDLVWRLARAGWTIRYEPRARVAHPTRSGWAAWLGQRYAYGTAAGPLARRHGGAVSPATLPVGSALAWLLVALGRPRLGAAVGAAWAAALTVRLPAPPAAAFRLALLGQARAGLSLASALRRAWSPAAVLLAAGYRKSRPALAAVLVVPPLLEWVSRRPGVDPVRYTGLRLADDLAYTAGVWAGSLRARSAGALLPVLTRGRPGDMGSPRPASPESVTNGP